MARLRLGTATIKTPASKFMEFMPDAVQIPRRRAVEMTAPDSPTSCFLPSRLPATHPPGRGPPPPPSIEPVRVQRRASNTGVITVAGQNELTDGDVKVVRRTNTQPVRSIKASGRGSPPQFLDHLSRITWQTRVAHQLSDHSSARITRSWRVGTRQDRRPTGESTGLDILRTSCVRTSCGHGLDHIGGSGRAVEASSGQITALAPPAA
jgi:hypothetical protein